MGTSPLRARHRLAAVAVAGASIAGLLAPAPSQAAEADTYEPPVPGPVVEGFDVAHGPFGPGNRGIDFATVPGEPVRAAGPGSVLFSGRVADALHVTVLHDDGLRTTYSFLASTAVGVGDRVVAGELVGTAADSLHFGVREPDDTYLDPAELFERTVVVGVRLVPHDEPWAERRHGDVVAAEWRSLNDRFGLGSIGRSVVRLGGQAAGVAGQHVASFVEARTDRFAATVQLVAHLADDLDPRQWQELAVALVLEFVFPPDCTASRVAVDRPRGDHVAILVAGLTSDSGHDGIDDLDLEAVGIDGDDVVRFSYDGGRIPPDDEAAVSWDDAIPVSDYEARDTFRRVRENAPALADLVRRVGDARPGATIEIYAHSLGGMIAVNALAQLAAVDLPARLITIATPHEGSDLATLGQTLSTVEPGVLGSLAPPVLHDLSETSDARTSVVGVPDEVDVLSIGARADLVVPADNTVVSGARNVIVPVSDPFSAHSDAVLSQHTAREIELFRAGLHAACQSRWSRLVNTVVPRFVAFAEDVASAMALQYLGSR